MNSFQNQMNSWIDSEVCILKIVVASDSFKGSLSSFQIGEIVSKVSFKIFGECEVVKIPLADGGEGTVDCLLESLNCEKIYCNVKNPIGKAVSAYYGKFGDSAVMEMAQASGITLVKDDERNILRHSTFGTGEMFLDAINKGCKNIYIGIGGSATNDGGMGFANALGVKFYKDETLLEAVPENFHLVNKVDLSEIDKRIYDTNITVMSDVTNPLLGETGATYVFGKQKGADEKTQAVLEKGMENYITVVEKSVGKMIRDKAGAGAAGGLGAALLAFTNAKLNSGVETILGIMDFKEKITNADLVITGEGMMDYQSAHGKLPYGVGKMCKAENIPCVALVGSMGKNAEVMYEHGINSILPIVNGVMSLDFAIENAEQLYYNAVERLFRIMKIRGW